MLIERRDVQESLWFPVRRSHPGTIYHTCVRVFLKRRPKNEDLRPKTPWTKTKTPWTKTKTPWTKTTEILWRRFGSVVEFPLQYLVVIIKSITYLSFRFLWKYFACFKPLWKCLRWWRRQCLFKLKFFAGSTWESPWGLGIFVLVHGVFVLVHEVFVLVQGVFVLVKGVFVLVKGVFVLVHGVLGLRSSFLGLRFSNTRKLRARKWTLHLINVAEINAQQN